MYTKAVNYLYTMDPQEWLKTNTPIMKGCDENWTWERYNFPQNVRNWIKNNWIKVNENGGGTYAEPNYYNKKCNDPEHAWYGMSSLDEPN